ncbi:hypothetical protein [Actinoplanes sp. NPDC049316]|uniref:hypothetical protein n=1 Tax=Actinoplanes sp. NPDC049316 TaxID=3154727 RepID=UPI00343165BD
MLLVGALAGRLVPSRWIVPAAPVLHLAAWELGRATVFRMAGPSFGRPSFGTAMGVLLFVAVHVLYALIVAVPLVLGAVAGRAWAHNADAEEPERYNDLLVDVVLAETRRG